MAGEMMQGRKCLALHLISEHQAESRCQHRNEKQVLITRFRWLVPFIDTSLSFDAPPGVTYGFGALLDRSMPWILYAELESIADASIDLHVFTLLSSLRPASLA